MAKFQMSYPVRPFKVNQGFGIANTSPAMIPTYQAMGLNAHNGDDLYATHGEPVHAAHDGIAYFEVDDNQGEGVVLRTNDQFDYNGVPTYYKSLYWHLCDGAKEPNFASPVLKYSQANQGQGMTVKRGDIIGYADNTGLSTGTHTHVGVKPIKIGNPDIEDATDVGIGAFVNVEQKNGYMGAIDPSPYWDGLYADTPIVILSPIDNMSIIAAQVEASGDTQSANFLWAFIAFIKSYFK